MVGGKEEKRSGGPTTGGFGSGPGGWRAISHPLIWKVIQKSPKSHPYVIQKSPKFQKSSNSNPTVLKSHPEDQQFPPIFTQKYTDSPHLFENHHTIQFVQSIKTKSPHLLLVQIELGHSSLMLVISRPQRQRRYGDYSRKCLHCLKFVSPSRRLALPHFSRRNRRCRTLVSKSKQQIQTNKSKQIQTNKPKQIQINPNKSRKHLPLPHFSRTLQTVAAAPLLANPNKFKETNPSKAKETKLQKQIQTNQ